MFRGGEYMKKKMPLICTIIFLLGIFVWSGITIKANESNIKFSNLYGERSELENVQFNLAKTKGIRMEDLIINSREIKSETSFSESGFDSIYSGFDVLDDKKFFRGLFITSETFMKIRMLRQMLQIKLMKIINILKLELSIRKLILMKILRLQVSLI